MIPYDQNGPRVARFHEALGSAENLRELRESIAEENMERAAGAQARRQRIIAMVVVLVALALLAGYLIAQVVMK